MILLAMDMDNRDQYKVTCEYCSEDYEYDSANKLESITNKLRALGAKLNFDMSGLSDGVRIYGVSTGTTSNPIYPSIQYPGVQIQSNTWGQPLVMRVSATPVPAVPPPVDASDILRFACMVGKRMLIRSTAYSYLNNNDIVEIKVLEFAPSYEFVKIQYPAGLCSWHESVKFLKADNKILEILDIEDKEGDNHDKSPGMPKL